MQTSKTKAGRTPAKAGRNIFIFSPMEVRKPIDLRSVHLLGCRLAEFYYKLFQRPRRYCGRRCPTTNLSPGADRDCRVEPPKPERAGRGAEKRGYSRGDEAVAKRVLSAG